MVKRNWCSSYRDSTNIINEKKKRVGIIKKLIEVKLINTETKLRVQFYLKEFHLLHILEVRIKILNFIF